MSKRKETPTDSEARERKYLKIVDQNESSCNGAAGWYFQNDKVIVSSLDSLRNYYGDEVFEAFKYLCYAGVHSIYQEREGHERTHVKNSQEIISRRTNIESWDASSCSKLAGLGT